MIVFEPETPAQISEWLRTNRGQVRIVGGNSKASWIPPGPVATLSTRKLNRILSIQPDDQVCTCEAGTDFATLQTALAEVGQTLPILSTGRWQLLHFLGGATVGGVLSANLPHVWMAQMGTFRDWTLGLQVVLANGTQPKCGSSVVKNVTGFDLHKLFVGGWGSLGVVTRVTLRTAPLPSLPPVPNFDREGLEPNWIQRVKATQFDQAFELLRAETIFSDPASGVIWARIHPGSKPQRFEGDWVLTTENGDSNISHLSESERVLGTRLLQTIDPNQRWLGGGPWKKAYPT